MDGIDGIPRSQVNMDRLDSESLTPSHPRYSKKAEKQTARQIRESQQKSLTFYSKRLCQHSDWDYIRTHAEDFPFQREAEPAKETILTLKNNQTYSQPGIIQSYGKLNSGDDICSYYARVFALGWTGTWKGCVSFPVDFVYPGRSEGSVPFQGQCANCHWGGQGWKCSVRVGRVKITPRCRRADLFQSKEFIQTHLGSKYGLDSTTGCENARLELQGIMNQLCHRSKKLRNNSKLDPVGDENARHNEDDDDEIYVVLADTKSIAPSNSPHRTRQIGGAAAFKGSRAAVVALDDDYDDNRDYFTPSNLPPISQARLTHRSSKLSARHSRSGIGIEVVIPFFKPPHQRLTRKSSSSNV
ncbi:hypothetical protein IFR05_009812 [Cadophora sp. M221]|nr:hypothetical protein IFR05_009812 [Cadophora sp. M221]